MAKQLNISHVYQTYISNQPFVYPDNSKNYAGNSINATWNTGWHIFPSILNKHFFTPKHWFNLINNNQAYHVDGITIEVFNMIPMTTQLAIQGTNVFTAFNNCIYGLGYTDTLYETPWENWYSNELLNYQHNLAYKEGLIYPPDSATARRYELPVYIYSTPRGRINSDQTCGNSPSAAQPIFPITSSPSGLFWDPFNRPEELKEFRPGKNAITFKWECHPEDKDKFFNLDAYLEWYPYRVDGPYQGGNRPGTFQIAQSDDPDILTTRYESNTWFNDFTWANFADQPVVPMGWAWKEMQNSIIQTPTALKPDLFFSGTEKEKYNYPPTQHFMKLCPLFDTNGHLVQVWANVSVKQTLHLTVKPRESAIYAPTVGPFHWKMLYSAKSRDLELRLPIIRGRTGGMRRSWQNMQRPTGSSGESQGTGATGHAREDPYQYPASSGAINSSGTGAGQTYTVTTSYCPFKSETDLSVTFSNKDLQRTVTARKIRLSPGHLNDRMDDLMI